MPFSCSSSIFLSRNALQRYLAAIAILLAAATISGCGGSSSPGKTIQPQGNTSVTILLSATSNNKLSQYELNFEDLTLTSQSGKTVSLLTTAQNASGLYTPEFVHLNANASTLMTANVPDDTYTSATLTVGGAQITCISVNNQTQSLTTSDFTYGAVPQNQVTVTLAEPIVVGGNAMNLSMQLDMTKSYTLDSCVGGNPLDAYTITPTFNLKAAEIASPATNYANGKEADVLGQVTTATNNGFTVQMGYNQGASTPLPTQSVTVNTATAYQGVSGLSALTAGTFVDMDLAVQADGSLLATRVAVEDPQAVDTLAGSLLQMAASTPVVYFYGGQAQGPDRIGGSSYYDISQASFHISGAFTNIATLPFTPSFTAANLVPGQNVYMTTPKYSNAGVNQYPLASTITLIPQTLDGVVTNVASSGEFNVYTISLAPYDLFVDMAGQPGATNLIAQPNQVMVYADNATSLADVTEPAADSTYRFHGLVFNDNGTLRMDCDEIAAGVAQ